MQSGDRDVGFCPRFFLFWGFLNILPMISESGG